MLREAYKIQIVNNNISNVGLIRMYKSLLADKRIEKGGCAHRRLMQLINDSNWWNKI